MSNYIFIDADKLKAAIERRKGYISVTHFAEELLSIINSLQQGPAEDTGITDVDKAAKVYAKGEYSHKNPSTLPDRCRGCYAPIEYAFKAGARWMKEKKEG